MEKMNLERVPAGGAGNKIIMLIRKKVGSMMFVDSKTSKWDSCAGEAIIRSMGGYSIKPTL
jgi:3'-phosphoadenosine 5'-phosphosulfate (PAPS) 3'-phosphatase